MSLLYECLKRKPKSLCWTDKQGTAFQEAKKAHGSAAMFPLSHKSLTLITDASSTAMGVVLEQDTDDSHRLWSSSAKKLSPAEQKYSTFDREMLLAVHSAV